MNKKIIIISSLAVVFLASLFLVYFLGRGRGQNTACFKNYCFNLEIAKTQKERTKGLMFRENLPEDSGMLFVFENAGQYYFWMKNTFIFLDIIWLSEAGEILYIYENAEPCGENECPVIGTERKAKYVLELNGGMAEKTGMVLGDKIELVFD